MLVGTAILLAVTGIVMIYSATRGKLALAGDRPALLRSSARPSSWSSAWWPWSPSSLFDYRSSSSVSTILYVGILLALLAVLSPPGSSQGAQRWFSLGPLQLQPSEFATLVLIIAIATYCSRRPEGLDFRDLVRLVLLAGGPHRAGDQAARPRDGHRAVRHPHGHAGRRRHARAVPVLLLSWARSWWSVRPQRRPGPAVPDQRLTSFISPNGASQSSIYNVTQAKKAIADGGFFGKGLFHGAQTNLSYVPEQQTDFIFSAVGEQLGFVGAGVLLLLYGVLAWRILRTAQMAQDSFGRLLCAGSFALIVFSVFENVGMNMGIMPVAGIPLPFLSYGGSAMIAFFAAVGITVSVHYRSTR